MTYNEKRSIYESIMKDVAKQVKKLINESDANSSLYSKLDEEFSILPPAPQKDIVQYDATGIEVVKKALNYIENNKEMLKLFLNSKIKAIVKSNQVLACATDFTNIYIQPKFIEDENLNEKQVALLILNSCVHSVLKHDRYEKNIMNSVFRDRFVNRYLEKKFPEFIGLTKSMSGVI